MGGGAGAADQSQQIRAEPHTDPAILDHRPRLRPRRHGFQETTSLSIPDELLEEIFLRLPTPADVVRASATCIAFRHLIADRSFLRRFRKLHAPPLLGLLDAQQGFQPAEPPHPSASAASVVALAGDFSFSFLPAPANSWAVQDSRDGRVLLDRAPRESIDERLIVALKDMVVCDPLHRRYLLLPPIPDDLAAMVDEPLLRKRPPHLGEAFLVPSGDGDVDGGAAAAQETSFRVISMVLCETKLVAFIFSSSTGQWRAVPTQSWSSLSGNLLSTMSPIFTFRKYAYGCFYWVTNWTKKLLVLDTQSVEFSMVDAPPVYGSDGCLATIAIVEAGEGRPGMFVRAFATSYVEYIIRENNGGSFGQWQREKIFSLGYQYFFIGSSERYLLLYKFGVCNDEGCFTLDVHTFQLERVNFSSHNLGFTYAYSNFPPSLSTPTVSSGTQGGAEKEILEQGIEALRAEGPINTDAGGRAGVSRIGYGGD